MTKKLVLVDHNFSQSMDWATDLSERCGGTEGAIIRFKRQIMQYLLVSLIPLAVLSLMPALAEGKGETLYVTMGVTYAITTWSCIFFAAIRFGRFLKFVSSEWLLMAILLILWFFPGFIYIMFKAALRKKALKALEERPTL